MLLPDPKYLNPGDNAWQLTAATLVGLMSIPGLAVLYGGLVEKRWALNSAMMTFYAFAAVLVVWVLFGFSMGFGQPLHLGPGILSGIVGVPHPVLSSSSIEGHASIPLLSGVIPSLRFPQSSLIYFQFVFAAISPIILAGAVLGRMSFKAWMIFVPAWSLLVYSVNAFMLWGGGWLGQLGAVDYSGGYVIHVAAGISGFVAAAVVGPRLKRRSSVDFRQLLIAVTGAGILWLGWNGFNGGDPYFANADAAGAVLNTNLATAVALLSWVIMDFWVTNKASLVGAVNGMICGLVAITPAAGYVNGYGAIAIGVVASVLPWLTMRYLPRLNWFHKVDDTLGVFHTHLVAGAIGGLMTGLLADPRMVEYLGVHGPNSSVAGLFYGNPRLFFVQLLALLVVVLYDGLMTWGIMKAIGKIVRLRDNEPIHLLEHQVVSLNDTMVEEDLDEPEEEEDEEFTAGL